MGTAWSDGTNWSDGTIWSDFPYELEELAAA